jgi:formylglycine-generating enzyme required for sulfatase activity
MTEESKDRYVKLGSLQLEMIWCQPGEFIMGCSEDEEGDSEDAQLHSVTLTRGFWLGRYQVTQAEYDTLAAAAGVPPSPSKYVGERRPVERVTWVNAVKWCQELTKREREAHRLPEGYEYRLPTEAEWEYACRAGSSAPFSGSGVLSEMAWYDENSDHQTHEVGRNKPNAWGFYDMHGNVLEWCSDWFSEPKGDAVDPKGPPSGSFKVLRGGCWFFLGSDCRCAYRLKREPNLRNCIFGFRVACFDSDAMSTPTSVQQK